MKKIIIMCCFVLLFATPIDAVSIRSQDNNHIPQSFDFGTNYYNVEGYPDLNASIIGSNELSRGKVSTLNLNVVNKGKIFGFENDERPSGQDEIFGAQIEMKQEGAIIDALNVVASLSTDNTSPFEIKTTDQQIGSIKSGQNAIVPVNFLLDIDKNAVAGEYNLYLNLSYDYQKNVQTMNPDAASQTYDLNRWYEQRLQTVVLKIKVKDAANFEIVNINGNIKQGKDELIELKIKNNGEEEAKNVKVIINPSDPLSTTDSMAFLSVMPPGNVSTAKIKVKADSAAVPKIYGIDTTIKYENSRGNIEYSDILEAPVEVVEAGWFEKLFGWI